MKATLYAIIGGVALGLMTLGALELVEKVNAGVEKSRAEWNKEIGQ